MLPPGLADALGRLDAGTLTAFAGALLQAEAARLGLPPGAVVFSHELSAPDGGLDMLVHGVPDGAPLPPGTSGWQLKTHAGTAPGALDLAAELAKPGPARLLAEGGAYVLLWPRQLNPKQHARALAALHGAAPSGTRDSQLLLVDGTALAALAARHLAVVEAFDLGALSAVRSLAEVERAFRVDELPYVPDERQAELVPRLRGLLDEPSEAPVIATVLGLPGTGKTRLVIEALRGHPLRHDTLFVTRWADLERLLRWAARDERSHGVAIADGLGPELDHARLEELAANLHDEHHRPRWRIVAIQPIVDPRPHPNAHRDLVVLPMDEATTAAIVERAGRLDPASAWRIASLATGFPGLALALARSARENPGHALGDIVQLSEHRALLARAIGDKELERLLAPLALFGAVGTDGDEAHELDLVAAAFSLSPGAMRLAVERERRRHRYVGMAGPYRFITPQALAVSLATELIETTPAFDQAIAALPPALRRAFHDQLSLFGGSNEALADALGRMVDASELITPAAFDDVAADLARAAATTIPETVAGKLRSIVAAADEQRLGDLPRPALVGALLRLLRHAPTTADALSMLFELGRVEPAAGLARRRFIEAFEPRSCATADELDARAAWLMQRIQQKTTDAGLALLAAAAHALGAWDEPPPRDPIPTAAYEMLDSAAELKRWRQRESDGEVEVRERDPLAPRRDLARPRERCLIECLARLEGPLTGELVAMTASLIRTAGDETIARLAEVLSHVDVPSRTRRDLADTAARVARTRPSGISEAESSLMAVLAGDDDELRRHLDRRVRR